MVSSALPQEATTYVRVLCNLEVDTETQLCIFLRFTAHLCCDILNSSACIVMDAAASSLAEAGNPAKRVRGLRGLRV